MGGERIFWRGGEKILGSKKVIQGVWDWVEGGLFFVLEIKFQQTITNFSPPRGNVYDRNRSNLTI